VLSSSEEAIVSQVYPKTADIIITTQVKNIDNGFVMSGLYLGFMWDF
jgi:hypothetical protein